MKILFVYSKLGLDGISTVIHRMAKSLTQNRHSVSILLMESNNIIRYSDPLIIQQVSQFATIIYAGKSVTNMLSAHTFNLVEKFDLIYAMGRESVLSALIMKKNANKETPFILGVYSTRDFAFRSHRWRIIKNIMDKVFAEIPAKNVLFMNKECLEAHERASGRDFSQSPIVPIPVDTASMKRCIRRHNRKKIVSIGRIVDWKTYNFIMLDVVDQLTNEGICIEYHIYGHGELEQYLSKQIEKRGLQDSIFLHGALPYADIPIVLTDAFLFIGMGTSLVEAAACGVPSLIAIESNPKPTTYGFFHEVDMGYAVGEVVEGLPMFSITEKIKDLLDLDETEYHRIEEQHRQQAEKFSIQQVMQIFIEHLTQAQPYNYSIPYWMALVERIDDFLWKFWRRLGIPDPVQYQWFRQDNHKT